MNPAVETTVATTKMAMVIDHLKNNRIEYLVLVLMLLMNLVLNLLRVNF